MLGRRMQANSPYDNVFLIEVSDVPECEGVEPPSVMYLSTGDSTEPGQGRALSFSQALELTWGDAWAL